MASLLTDSFTGADGTTIGAHTAEIGGPWSAMTGYAGGSNPLVIRGNRLYCPNGDPANLWLGANVNVADGEFMQCTIIKVSSSNSGAGVVVRGSTSPANGYFAWYYSEDNVLIINKVISGVFTELTRQALVVAVGGSVNLKFKATGTGASVLLEVFINGASSATLSYTDTSAQRLTAFGRGGVFFTGPASASIGLNLDNLTDLPVFPSTAGLAVNTPLDGRIHQRAGVVGSIPVAGSFTALPATIEARLVNEATGLPISGFDWSTKVASPTGTNYAATFANVPQYKGWYQVQVRDSAAPNVVAASGKVGVGILLASTGQSNAFNMLRHFGANTQVPSPLTRAFGQISPGTWSALDPATSDGAIAMCNNLVEAFGCPVGYLDVAADGSSLHGDWIPLSNNAYQYFKNTILALDGKVEAVFWTQGETDAAYSISQGVYYGDLTSLFAQMRSDLGQPNLPIILSTLQSIPLGGFANDESLQAIKNAQIQKCADANIYRVERNDLEVTDGIHHTAAAYVKLGLRIALVVKFLAGLVDNYRSPYIANVDRVSSTILDVAIKRDSSGGYHGGTTGWRVLDGSTEVTIASAVRRTNGKMRLTLSAPLAGTATVQYAYGKNPSIVDPPLSNASLPLPIEANAGVVAVALATTVSFAVVDASGSPVTGLTNLDYAFYDQPRISAGQVPIKSGSTVSVSAGVGTLDIAGLTSLTPGSFGRLEFGDSSLVKAAIGQVAVT
jgi:hypothetical protein